MPHLLSSEFPVPKWPTRRNTGEPGSEYVFRKVNFKNIYGRRLPAFTTQFVIPAFPNSGATHAAIELLVARGRAKELDPDFRRDDELYFPSLEIIAKRKKWVRFIYPTTR